MPDTYLGTMNDTPTITVVLSQQECEVLEFQGGVSVLTSENLPQLGWRAILIGHGSLQNGEARFHQHLLNTGKRLLAQTVKPFESLLVLGLASDMIHALAHENIGVGPVGALTEEWVWFGSELAVRYCHTRKADNPPVYLNFSRKVHLDMPIEKLQRCRVLPTEICLLKHGIVDSCK